MLWNAGRNLTANIAKIASGIGREGFKQIESSDVQDLPELQDGDLTESDLEEMLNSQPIEKEASTSIGNVTFIWKNLSEGLSMANELCDFIMKIDSSMERSLIFKRQIANAAAEYQSELKELLKLPITVPYSQFLYSWHIYRTYTPRIKSFYYMCS